MKRFSFILTAAVGFLTAVLFSLAAAENTEKGTSLEWFPTVLEEPASERRPDDRNVVQARDGQLPAEEDTLRGLDDTFENAMNANPGQETEESSEVLEINSIQDFWNHYEVSDSFRDHYADGEAWKESEENLFVLYHLHEHLRLVRLEEWALPESALETLDSLEKTDLNKRRLDA
ncbi:MAG: hypothetical protein Q4D17_09070, partial [Planctomycetia bacterium]|nr:hypothetical protein [Planctomycetia bacterium]